MLQVQLQSIRQRNSSRRGHQRRKQRIFFQFDQIILPREDYATVLTPPTHFIDNTFLESFSILMDHLARLSQGTGSSSLYFTWLFLLLYILPKESIEHRLSMVSSKHSKLWEAMNRPKQHDSVATIFQRRLDAFKSPLER